MNLLGGAATVSIDFSATFIDFSILHLIKNRLRGRWIASQLARSAFHTEVIAGLVLNRATNRVSVEGAIADVAGYVVLQGEFVHYRPEALFNRLRMASVLGRCRTPLNHGLFRLRWDGFFDPAGAMRDAEPIAITSAGGRRANSGGA